MLSYYDEQNKIKGEELREKLKELPKLVTEFVIGIEMRTSVLTRLNYVSDIAIFFDYLTHSQENLVEKNVKDITLDDLNTLTASDIESFLSYLSYYNYRGVEYKNGQKAKARKLSAVRSLFKHFYNKDKLSQNVSAKVATPKLHDKPIIRLENDEVKNMLNGVEGLNCFFSEHQNNYNIHTKDRDVALLTLLLGTGIRVSECVGLNVDDINFNDNSFIVTRKGGNKSILYFSNEVSYYLKTYMVERKNRLIDKEIADEKALFLSLQNKRISVRAVEILVKKYAQNYSPLKKISPHKLRSTYGTSLYKSTKDIYVVAEVLGHRDINTTKKHYAAISEDIKRDASTKVVLRDDSFDA